MIVGEAKPGCPCLRKNNRPTSFSVSLKCFIVVGLERLGEVAELAEGSRLLSGYRG